MRLEDYASLWGSCLTLLGSSLSQTPLKVTMGGSKQEECCSEHLELERFREPKAYVDDTVKAKGHPPPFL